MDTTTTSTTSKEKVDMKAPPSWNSKLLSYDSWRFEVELWNDWTTVPKEKRGRLVLVSLPIDDPSGARDKVRIALQNGDIDINCEDGVDEIIRELDKSYKKDELSVVCESWANFISYKRGSEGISVYITEFEKRASKLKRERIRLPDVILGMQILNGAGLNHSDRQIVLTAVDYSKEGEIFAQMKNALRKFHGNSITSQAPLKDLSLENVSLKEEYVHATADQVFATREFQRGYRGRGNTYNRRGFREGYRGRWRGSTSNGAPSNPSKSGDVNRKSDTSGRRINPIDPYGNIMRCNVCESIRHFQHNCPDAWENMKDINEVKDVFKVSDLSMIDNEVLMCEATNAAILDSACTKTVTGVAWRDAFLDSLTVEERQKSSAVSRRYEFQVRWRSEEGID